MLTVQTQGRIAVAACCIITSFTFDPCILGRSTRNTFCPHHLIMNRGYLRTDLDVMSTSTSLSSRLKRRVLANRVFAVSRFQQLWHNWQVMCQISALAVSALSFCYIVWPIPKVNDYLELGYSTVTSWLRSYTGCSESAALIPPGARNLRGKKIEIKPAAINTRVCKQSVKKAGRFTHTPVRQPERWSFPRLGVMSLHQ